MVVTLWEEKAYQFLKAVAETQVGVGPLFVVISGLLAKKFSGQLEGLVLILYALHLLLQINIHAK